MSDTTLDVRPEPRMHRHELVFSTFENLGEGESFVLVNDHDPIPLRSQFEFVRAGKFTWDYIESGPDVWRVRIGRTGS